MTQRIALGHLGSTDYGLKVSKAGIDVLAGSDAEMLFDSRTLNTRIIMIGSIADTAGSNAVRRRINNVSVVLPAISYEPLVWANFAYRVSSVSGGGQTDVLGGRYYGGAWLGNLQNANPMDYANWTWDASTYTLTFNAETIIPEPMSYEVADIIHFRYIIFSSRNGA